MPLYEEFTEKKRESYSFGYPLWNKIVFLLLVVPFTGLFIAMNIDTIRECAHAERVFVGSYDYLINGEIRPGCIWGIWGNVGWIIFLVLLLDFFASRLFGKVIITQSELIYNSGGFIWRWFLRRNLPWKDYKFYLYYWVDWVTPRKNSHTYSFVSIHGIDKKSNKVRFKLKSRYPEFMEGIAEAIEKYSSDYERVRKYSFIDRLDNRFNGW